MTAPLPRVRVTAPRSGSRDAPPAAGPGDPSTVYVRSLIRSQLRLALLAGAGFGAVLVGIAVALAFVPGVREFTILGVPLAWFVLGVGIYPLVLLVAGVVVRAAERNEARYRSLTEDA